MSPTTCKNCGLVCFAMDKTCTSCGAPLGPEGVQQSGPAVNQSESDPRVPSYGLPSGEPAGARSYSTPGSGIWRRGSVLAFHKSATLPDRCIRCNEPALGTRVNKTLYWHHPAVYLLIPAGLLIYAIAAMVVRKRAKVSIGLCRQHKQQRTRMLTAGWLLFGVSLVAFFGALAEENGYIALAGLTLLIAAVVLSLLGGRFISVKRIDDNFVYLNGVHPDYLDEFPSV